MTTPGPAPITPDVERRIDFAALDLYALVVVMSGWQIREDGLVYSDEPIDGYLDEARHLVAYITSGSS